MQREEKALEAALEALITRVTDVRNTIVSFLMKLEHEHETLNWPSMLDSFALLSGQVNTLLKVMKNEKTPPTRNLIVLPLLLSPDRDEELIKLTENRISAFSHEVVPDYLRTKPDPDVEARENQLVQRANQVPYDGVLKMVSTMNKLATTILDHINTAREEWESELGARANTAQTSSLADTHLLISAVCLGKGLKMQCKLQSNTGSSQGQSTQPQAQPPITTMTMGKAPSAIKTNIKSAASHHPYSR